MCTVKQFNWLAKIRFLESRKLTNVTKSCSHDYSAGLDGDKITRKYLRNH